MRKRTGLLAIAIAGVLASSLGATASAAPQADGTWNDQYIKAPRAIAAAAIDDCRYQISFQRDSVDSRYTPAFDAEFRSASGAVTSRPLAAETGGLAFPEVSLNTGAQRYRVGNGYSLAPFQVNICSAQAAGETLAGFRLRLSNGGGYDYTNDYRSTRITPVAVGAVPTAPKVTALPRVMGSDNLSLTWTPSTGGTQVSYRVIVRKPVYYGGEITWAHSIATVDTTTTSATVPLGTYKPELDRQVTVIAFGGNGFVSDTNAATELTVKP